MKYFDLFFRDSKVFASFSNLFFSETIDWISAIQCRISIVINRVVFSPNSCLVYFVFTATIYIFLNLLYWKLHENQSSWFLRWAISRSLFSPSPQVNAKRSLTSVFFGGKLSKPFLGVVAIECEAQLHLNFSRCSFCFKISWQIFSKCDKSEIAAWSEAFITTTPFANAAIKNKVNHEFNLKDEIRRYDHPDEDGEFAVVRKHLNRQSHTLNRDSW